MFQSCAKGLFIVTFSRSRRSRWRLTNYEKFQLPVISHNKHWVLRVKSQVSQLCSLLVSHCKQEKNCNYSFYWVRKSRVCWLAGFNSRSSDLGTSPSQIVVLCSHPTLPRTKKRYWRTVGKTWRKKKIEKPEGVGEKGNLWWNFISSYRSR